MLPDKVSNLEPPDPESGALPIELSGKEGRLYPLGFGLRPLDSSPGVAKGGDAVVDRAVVARVFVEPEVADPLELEPGFGGPSGGTWLDESERDLHGVRIQIVQIRPSFGHVVRVGDCEQVVEETRLDWLGGGLVEPVNGGLHFASVGRIAA